MTTYQSNSIYNTASIISSTQADGTTFKISKDFERQLDLETGTNSVSFVLVSETQIERFKITATGGTATIVKRGLTQSSTETEDVSLQKQWGEGSIGYVTILAFDQLDKQNTKPARLTIPTVADVTARDALYPSPTGGEIAEVTSLGATQRFNSSTLAWESFDIGTPTPLASQTVAGTEEVATTAESKAGTDTGGTGAFLSVLPSDIAANTQSGTFLYANSADVTDTYTASLTPALTAYTTGMRVVIKFDTANTGACTLNINTLGAKSIKTREGGDPGNGYITAGDFTELVYDGTNFVIVSAPHIATLAEATTGTDTTKVINASVGSLNWDTAYTDITVTLNNANTNKNTSAAFNPTKGGSVSIRVNCAYGVAAGSATFGFEYSSDGGSYTNVYSVTLTSGQSADEYYTFIVKPGGYLRGWCQTDTSFQ
jgi:hypothetical protein